MPFQLDIQQTEPQKAFLTFSGSLNEEVDLPNLAKLGSSSSIVFDLKSLEAINSLGILELRDWLSKLPSEKLIFQNCPHCFITQVNIINDLLPDRAVIESCFVPYFCEKTSEEKAILFQRGIHYKRRGDGEPEVTPPVESDISSGQIFEIDVSVKNYFRFVKKFA